MAVPFDLQFATVTSGAATASSPMCCTDGTYVWLLTMPSASAPWRLWRFRHSDKNWINPAGVIGTGADAYQTCDTIPQGYNSMCAGGAYIAVDQRGSGGGAGIQGVNFYRKTDMGLAARESLDGSSVSGYRTVFDGTYFYLCDAGSANNPSITRIHATTLVANRRWINSGFSTTTRARSLVIGGAYIYLCPDGLGKPQKFRLSDGASILDGPYDMTAGVGYGTFYDSVRDEIYVPAGDGEFLRIRCSDMAYLTATGTVAGSYAAAVIKSGVAGSELTRADGCFAFDGQVYTSGFVGAAKRLTRRSSDPARASQLGYGVTGTYLSSSLDVVLVPSCMVGNTLYFTMTAAGVSGTIHGLAYLETTVASPNLTNVSPGLTPQHISLTFDNPVTATAPTLGPAAGELGVSGATQISPTQIDLACAIAPPTITALTPNATGMLLAFDYNVSPGSPTLGPPYGSLSVTGATGPTATSLQLGLTVAPPNLTEVAPNATGLLAVFSHPVTVTAPPILDAPYNGLIATGATNPLTDRIQFALTVPVAGATATTLLLSAIAYNLRIDLTFNKNVALTTIGLIPSSYVITTTTPGAVIPEITSITANNAVVTIHTTEQTTGAIYTVAISPGSIIATG